MNLLGIDQEERDHIVEQRKVLEIDAARRDTARRTTNHVDMVKNKTGAYSEKATAKRSAALADMNPANFTARALSTPLGRFVSWAVTEMRITHRKSLGAISREASPIGSEQLLAGLQRHGTARRSTIELLAAVLSRYLDAGELETRIRAEGGRWLGKLAVTDALTAAMQELLTASWVGRPRPGPATGMEPHREDGAPIKRVGRPKGSTRSQVERAKQSASMAATWATKGNDAAVKQGALLKEGRNRPHKRALRFLKQKLGPTPSPTKAELHAWASEANLEIRGFGSEKAVLAGWEPELRRRGISSGTRGRTSDIHTKVCDWLRVEPLLSWASIYRRLNQLPDDAPVDRSKWVSLANSHSQWHQRNEVSDCRHSQTNSLSESNEARS